MADGLCNDRTVPVVTTAQSPTQIQTSAMQRRMATGELVRMWFDIDGVDYYDSLNYHGDIEDKIKNSIFSVYAGSGVMYENLYVELVVGDATTLAVTVLIDGIQDPNSLVSLIQSDAGGSVAPIMSNLVTQTGVPTSGPISIVDVQADVFYDASFTPQPLTPPPTATAATSPADTPPPTPAGDSDGDGTMIIIIVCIVAAVICLLAGGCVCMFWRRRQTSPTPGKAAVVGKIDVVVSEPQFNPLPSSTPNHWTGDGINDQGWELVPVSKAELGIIQSVLRVTRPSELGIGLDSQAYGRKYTNLAVHCAWRFESQPLWQVYSGMNGIIRSNIKRMTHGGVAFQAFTTDLDSTSSQLPGPLHNDINEKFLLHGTNPSYVLNLLQNGLNDRMSKSSGAFGGGVYLAEAIEKIDQYCTPDPGFETPGLEDLHSRLFRAGGNTHPREDLFYCFIVRAACGVCLRTRGIRQDKDPKIYDCDNGKALFHSAERRELAAVEGISPPVHHNTLVVETGKGLKRFREFVVYESQNLYIEYLVGFKRV
jgi:hypothetical protein